VGEAHPVDTLRTRQGHSGTRRRWAIHPLVQERLEELVDTHPRWPKMQIVLRLENDEKLNGLLPKSDKTLQRAIDDLLVKDESGSWSPIDSLPEDAADLLEMLAALHEWTDYTVRELTFDEAKWLSSLRVATDGLDHRARWRITMQQRRRRARHASTADLDLYLGYKPWRSADHAARYQRALAHDPVLHPPGWLFADLEGTTYQELERLLGA
jgi:hypothetical protein